MSRVRIPPLRPPRSRAGPIGPTQRADRGPHDMTARIYKPAKTAMQSGRAKTLDWVLDFDLKDAQQRDPLMGWAGSRDTARQLDLRFQTREEAVAYAKKHGIDYV